MQFVRKSYEKNPKTIRRREEAEEEEEEEGREKEEWEERKRKNKTAFITQHVLRTDGAELCIKAFYVAHVVERGSRARARVRNKMFSGEFSHLNPGVSPAVININTAGAAQLSTARLVPALGRRSRSVSTQLPSHHVGG